MTTPEVHEINDHPAEPIGPEGTAGMHAGFEDSSRLPQPVHQTIREADRDALRDMMNSGELVVNKHELQRRRNLAIMAINNAQSSIPKKRMN